MFLEPVYIVVDNKCVVDVWEVCVDPTLELISFLPFFPAMHFLFDEFASPVNGMVSVTLRGACI